MHPDLVPYHLTCDQSHLIPELGPPDFYPLVPVSLACSQTASEASTTAQHSQRTGQQRTTSLHTYVHGRMQFSRGRTTWAEQHDIIDIWTAQPTKHSATACAKPLAGWLAAHSQASKAHSCTGCHALHTPGPVPHSACAAVMGLNNSAVHAAWHMCAVLQGSCPEDSLDAATLAGGYKWVPDALRITEANEPLLSLTCHNSAYWEKHNADALREVGVTARLSASGWLCMGVHQAEAAIKRRAQQQHAEQRRAQAVGSQAHRLASKGGMCMQAAHSWYKQCAALHCCRQ